MTEILFHYTKKEALLFVVFLLMYEISTYISNDMIMPGMLAVVHSFHAPDTYVSASLTAFILGGATLQLFLGPISDRFGRRSVMLFGAGFFVLCTMLITLSTNIHQFILMRYFQGMGLCFIGVIGYATLQEIYTEKYAVRIISIMSNITILAPLIGPLLGSVIMEVFSWRVIFHVIAVTAGISLIGLWKYMPETIAQTKIDGTYYAATPLKFSVLMRNYYRLITNKKFMLGACAAGLQFIPLIAWIGTSPLILIKDAHLRVLFYGLWQIPIFFMSFVGTIFMRHFLKKTSLDTLLKFGSVIMFVSALLMVIALLLDKHYISIVIGLSFYCFGMGFASGPLNRMVLFFTDVPKGTTAALTSIITMVFLASGTQLSGWLYAQSFNNLIFGLLCLVSTALYFLMIVIIYYTKEE